MLDAIGLLLDPAVLAAMLIAAVYGLFVGAIPGLTATMAVALVIPITFFLDPLPALAAVMSLAAMAIFAGDLPGALLRIPGTPASAAYTEDAHRMVQKGQGGLALGLGLVASALGGVVGAVVLIGAAPSLARIALQFSSYEKFWLACLGLTAAVAVSHGHWIKAALSLLIGLAIAQVGLDPVSGLARFTLGSDLLIGGLGFIPVLIGVFAVPQVLRYARDGLETETPARQGLSNILTGVGRELRRLRWGIARGSTIGVVIGAIPGAGADIAAYVSYAISRRLSSRSSAFGTGIPDGIGTASAANNASIGGALVPATVFGIPGDSLTAIIIGVLFLKGLNPGPTVFLTDAALINAVFLSYLLANLLLVPLGLLAILAFQPVMAAPKALLMPAVLVFCIVGAFAVENTLFAVGTMLGLGVAAYVLEEHGFPMAPLILGVVIGPMLEETFLNSLIRARGDLWQFVERPVSTGLALVTVTLWLLPLALLLWRRLKSAL
jgi:TctA family transporter